MAGQRSLTRPVGRQAVPRAARAAPPESPALDLFERARRIFGITTDELLRNDLKRAHEAWCAADIGARSAS